MLNNIALRKLLKILYLPANDRRAEIRRDIREEISREAGERDAGGDFYVPFWADAKRHVFSEINLHFAVEDRIEINGRRANLYPHLRDGFLTWWNNRRRWHNAPFEPVAAPKTHFPFPGLEAVVKVDNFLAVRDSLGARFLVYPYFAPDPELSDEAAQLGLWLLCRAFPYVNPMEFRILDVIRGRTFSLDRFPLIGNEEQIFARRYQQALNERLTLLADYR